jgi:hypothetical protein
MWIAFGFPIFISLCGLGGKRPSAAIRRLVPSNGSWFFVRARFPKVVGLFYRGIK